jgi:competence ComEA-like helix-hairpin-helix protein
MRNRLTPACFLVLIIMFFGAPAASAFADESAAPLQEAWTALSPETTNALQNAPESDNASAVDDASNFVSDNAPFFIIGVIVLAAILAGILIMRGRRKKAPVKLGAAAASPASASPEPKAAATSAAARASTPASVPSATELRRRKRAAMQRAREEERLRRRADKGAGKVGSPPVPQSAPVNPVEVEKQAARDQANAAGAVGRVGTTITPPAASQPAPSSPAQSGPASAMPAPTDLETPTAVNPLPDTDGEDIIAPAPDAAVGRAAAAFAAGGLVAGQAGKSGPEDALQAKVEEIKAAQGSSPPVIPERPDPTQPAPPLITGLSAVERQLSADSAERDRALKAAEERLQEIERRAEDAERRAAFAERLARLKLEESERERRLDDVMSGIDRAEERAREAEERAEAAERAAASALEQGSIRRRSADFEEAAVPPPPAPSTPAPRSTGSLSGGLNLNSATFEELRDAELSVTQATRILAYRERFGGYSSIEDLEKVPGFPTDTVESLRGRFTV